MTKEESIDEIKRWTPILLNSGQCTEKTSEAQDLAISALSEKDWKFYYDHGYAQAKRDLSKSKKDFDEMTNREIISEFVEQDDSFAIMVDEVNGTVNIELSLDFWNAPYKAKK